MKVILLGTGTPYPEVNRFGSAILVEAGGKKLLFDCGRGAVIRLAQAGVNPSDIDKLFLTHLHSDHVVGVPDLWLTGWFLGRDKPLRVWGPRGTRSMTQHLVEAFAFDIKSRLAVEHLSTNSAEIDAQEVSEGKVYEDGALRVAAFLVDHGPVRPALGYRVDYSGHSVAISGDTKFSQHLVNVVKGVDCLIQVAWGVGVTNPTPPSLRSIASAEDAARVFALVTPRLAVVYHYKDQEGVEEAVRAAYKGPFVLATDLMSITIDHGITWHGETSSGKVQ